MNEREFLQRARLDRATYEISVEQRWLIRRRRGGKGLYRA